MKTLFFILAVALAFLAGANFFEQVNLDFLQKKPATVATDEILHADAEPTPSVSAPVLSQPSDYERRTIATYKQTNAAVVFISTLNISRDPYSIFGTVRPEKGSGSGVIIDETQGLIITNLHVINNAQKIEILLNDGLRYPAKLIGYDDIYDLAVLQLKTAPENLVSIPMGQSDNLDVGQMVLAIGNPFGLNRSLTTGIISSLNRSLKTAEDKFLQGLIQTDAAINPGNSGGPLLNLDGELIGINTVILSSSGDSAGIGFAIPIDDIKKILPELIANGKVERPSFDWLLTDTKLGIMVQRLDSASKLAEAGVTPLEQIVRRGRFLNLLRDYQNVDFVTEFAGVSVRDKQQLQKAVRALVKGEPVQITVAKLANKGGSDRQTRTIEITPQWQ